MVQAFDIYLSSRKEYVMTRLPAEPGQILYAHHVQERDVEFVRKVWK
jgi:hypothetical protein